MADNVYAKDLMLPFRSIANTAPVGEALAELVALQQRADLPNAVVVEDSEGTYQGLLTSRLLLQEIWCEEAKGRSDALRIDATVTERVQQRLTEPVNAVLRDDLPSVTRDARLMEMITVGRATRLEFLPVLEDGRAVGLVPVTALFRATAALALTPEDQGIRFEQ